MKIIITVKRQKYGRFKFEKSIIDTLEKLQTITQIL